MSHKFKIIGIFILACALTVTLAACDMNGNGVEEASLSGSLISEVDEEFDSSYAGLLVLEAEGEEVARKYNSFGEETFRFEDLSPGEYSLNVYQFNAEDYSQDILVEEGENSLGEIEIDLEDTVLEEEKSRVDYIGVNIQESHLDDEDIRKALSHAMNKDNLADIIEDVAEDDIEVVRAERLVPPAVIGYDEGNVENLSYDIEKANELLEGKGDFEIELYYNEDNEVQKSIAEKIQEDINEHIDNLDIEVEGIPFEQLLERESIYTLRWRNLYRTPLFFLRVDDIRDNLSASGEELLNKAKMNLDSPVEALDYIIELEEKLIEEAKIIPIAYR